MYYNECPYCGDTLDPGEKCECQDTKPEREYKPIAPMRFHKGLTFETQLNGKIKVYAGKSLIYG